MLCYNEDTISNAFEKMITSDVGRLLIKSRGENLCGIISMADILGNAPQQVIGILQQNSRKNKNTRNEPMEQSASAEKEGRMGDDRASRRTQREGERIQDRVGELA